MIEFVPGPNTPRLNAESGITFKHTWFTRWVSKLKMLFEGRNQSTPVPAEIPLSTERTAVLTKATEVLSEIVSMLVKSDYWIRRLSTQNAHAQELGLSDKFSIGSKSSNWQAVAYFSATTGNLELLFDGSLVGCPYQFVLDTKEQRLEVLHYNQQKKKMNFREQVDFGNEDIPEALKSAIRELQAQLSAVLKQW